MCVQGQHTDTVNFVIWQFSIRPFLTFDPLSVGQTKRLTWTLLHPRLTHWPFHFCHLTHFVIWPFFDLWPLNRRSKRSLWTLMHVCPTDTLTLLLLLLNTFCNLTFDPLTIGRTKRSPWTLMHVCPTPTHQHCYFCYLKLFVIWPRFLTCDPHMTPDWPVIDNFHREYKAYWYVCVTWPCNIM